MSYKIIPLADGSVNTEVNGVVQMIIGPTGDVTFPNAKFLKSELRAPIATTSGLFVDFENIPSWAKKLTLLLDNVSLNGTADVVVQLATAAGLEITNYFGTSTRHHSTGNYILLHTNGFNLTGGSALATVSFYGEARFTLLGANKWAGSSHIANVQTPQSLSMAGVKGLAGVLNRLRVTTSNGTDAFDLGAVSLLIEG